MEGNENPARNTQPPAKRVAAGDLVFATLLVIFGVYVSYTAANMRVYQTVLDAPGLFPFVLGLVLTLLGVLLTVSSLKQGAVAQLREMANAVYVRGLVTGFGFQRVLFLTLLMIAYMFVLIGRMHFILATFFYLAVTFYYLKSTSPVRIIVIAALCSFLIGYSFRNFFGIPLP